MKRCPKCNQQYEDQNLNFCLSDGEMLIDSGEADATPTVYMDSPRVTNQNWEQQQPNQPEAGAQRNDQQIFQQPFSAPQNYPTMVSKDKSLATVSLVLGIMSLLLMCCYLGFPLGAGAFITGYIAIGKVSKDPSAFGGKELAIIGMVLGGISLALSAIFIVLWLVGTILGG